MSKKVIVNLIDMTARYNKAGLEEREVSNHIHTQFLTLIMTVSLAELAFLGTFELGKDQPARIAVYAAIALVVSMFMLALSMYLQKLRFSQIAEYNFNLAKKCEEIIKREGKYKFDKLPEEVEVDYDSLKMPKITGYLNMTVFALVSSATIMILVLLWTRI